MISVYLQKLWNSLFKKYKYITDEWVMKEQEQNKINKEQFESICKPFTEELKILLEEI